MEDLSDLCFGPSSATPGPGYVNHSQKGASSFDYLSASIARPTHLHHSSSSSSSSRQNHRPSSTADPRTPATTTTSNSATDAFSSLFSDPIPSGSALSSTMATKTMAERLKVAQAQKLQQLPDRTPTSTLTTPSTSRSPVCCSASQIRVNAGVASSPPSAATLVHGDKGSFLASTEPWDFDLLSAAKPSMSRANSRGFGSSQNISGEHSSPTSWKSVVIDHLSELDDGSASSHFVQDRISQTIPHETSLADLDSKPSLLGDEFGPLESSHHVEGAIALSEDPLDILGPLAVPIAQVQSQKHNQREAQLIHQPQRSKASPNRSSQSALVENRCSAFSPPPHILGQVVEMGFSPAQSRQALLQNRDATSGQWNVQASVNALLGSQQGPPNQLPRLRSRDEGTSRPRAQHCSPTSAQGIKSNFVVDDPSLNLGGLNGKEIQDQAAELLAQASAYGTTALGKAASFWKHSKASITKVIEEQTGPSFQTPTKDKTTIRPKWMKETPTPPLEDQLGSQVSFEDTSSSFRSQAKEKPNSTAPPSSISETGKASTSSIRRKVAERSRNVLDHGVQATPQLESQLDLLSPKSSAGLASWPGVKPPPELCASGSCLVFPRVKVVTVSQQQINRSSDCRNRGNKFFKQGQYANAESAYSQALNSFSISSHESPAEQIYLGCLPLYNNRAAARLKNGDGKGAKEDADKVIEVLFGEDHQLNQPCDYLSRKMKWNQSRIPDELKGTIDLDEQLGKALSKRARIKEDLEQWDDAKSDWEACRNLFGGVTQGAGGIRIVAEGVTRCQKALRGSTSGMALKAARTSPKRPIAPRPAQFASSQSAAAVAIQKLRQADKQAESEANIKLESKDMVDSMILNWKSGKETNLRALLASLDQVLWEGLNWKKVGMGELLTEAQVKSKYVRAISKVHPDKIPKEASVVEQMIAKSVFAALNEAWLAMQK